MKIGLTGGMGCGKSTALKMFAEAGCRTLDSDRIVRDEVLVDAAVIAEVAARFQDVVVEVGNRSVSVGIVAAGGLGEARVERSGAAGISVAIERRIDRAKLAARIFENESARLWLERLFHPRVEAAWARSIAGEPQAIWVIEVPLLFEKGFEKGFDFTVCVRTTPTRQLARLAERGITQALAEQRIFHQLPLAKKIELSDFVLSNDGSTEHLRAQIASLLAHLPRVPRS